MINPTEKDIATQEVQNEQNIEINLFKFISLTQEEFNKLKDKQ